MQYCWKLVKGYKLCHEQLLKNTSSSGVLYLSSQRLTEDDVTSHKANLKPSFINHKVISNESEWCMWEFYALHHFAVIMVYDEAQKQLRKKFYKH